MKSLNIKGCEPLSAEKRFQMVVNLLTMPLVFMSGVFYPVTTMPDWMKTITMFNPLTYAVHSVRYWLVGSTVGFDYMNPYSDLAVLLGFTTAALGLAVRAFKGATLED